MQPGLADQVRRVEQKFAHLRALIDLTERQVEIQRLEASMAEPGFWDDAESANTVIRQLKAIRRQVEPFLKNQAEVTNVVELFALAQTDDEELQQQLSAECQRLQEDLERLEIDLLLAAPEDRANVFLGIHAGAGGTEACDWTSMLLRMYQRWAEDNDCSAEIVDILPGEEAGVKNVTLLIKGQFAYGRLKSEQGVHRLVRISPFDANKRRHTSFASVEVAPEVTDDIVIEVREEDLRVDVYRSSGAGGQHVNKTDSAVRMTHIPSGIVVSCQVERSQIKNRAMALKMLKAKLYELELEKRQAETDKVNAQKKKIEWGSQIRSYVMHPYSLVKDHRTGVETGNVAAVMDGKLDMFIDGYLRGLTRAADAE